MTVSQPCGHWWHDDNHVNYVLGMWFHTMQLSTTFIPSRNFVYLLQCSAVDIQTHNITIQTVPPSLPAVGQNYLMLTHFWPFFSLVMKGLNKNIAFQSAKSLSISHGLSHRATWPPCHPPLSFSESELSAIMFISHHANLASCQISHHANSAIMHISAYQPLCQSLTSPLWR